MSGEIVVSCISDFSLADGSGPAFEGAVDALKERLKLVRIACVGDSEFERLYVQYRGTEPDAVGAVRVGRYSTKHCSLNVVIVIDQPTFVTATDQAAMNLLTAPLKEALRVVETRLAKAGIQGDLRALEELP